MPASISIAIRNSIIREGLRRIFMDACFEVAESVSDLEELDLSFYAASEQHILVIERDLLQEECAAILERMQHEHANLRIVVLTGTFDFDEMIALYAAGAFAYFPDNVPYLSLVAILQMVSNGQKVAPPEVIDFLISMPAASRPTASGPSLDAYKFRERELRVLEHLALGQPNKAISREMGINETAVKAAVKAILRKLGVENRTQAAVMARELIRQPGSDDADPHAGEPSEPLQEPEADLFGSHDSAVRQFGGGGGPRSIGVERTTPNSRNNLLQAVIRKTSICLCYFQAFHLACLS